MARDGKSTAPRPGQTTRAGAGGPVRRGHGRGLVYHVWLVVWDNRPVKRTDGAEDARRGRGCRQRLWWLRGV